MEKPFIVAAALVMAAPTLFAAEQTTTPGASAAARKAHAAHSAADRHVAKSLQATGVGTAALGAAAKPQTRDWSKIDTNQDHLISPEEMQRYLDQSRAAPKN